MPIFKLKGYELKFYFGWINPRKKLQSQEKPLVIQNGYECYVGCIVQKDGKDVIIKNDEYDCELSATWEISHVEWYLFQKRIYCWKDISYDDVEEDLKELLACLDTSEQMPQKEESVEEKRHKQSMKDIIIKIVVFIFSPVILIGMLLGLVVADDVSDNFGRNVAIASGVFILILIAVIVLSVLYL